MPAIFTKWFPSGFRLIKADLLNSWFNIPQTSIEDSITATVGGGQANAYSITAAKSRVSVCATNGDSVKLPKSSQNVGAEFLIINDGAANLNIFPFDTATIDGGAASASVTLTAGRRAYFWCVASGAWQSGFMTKSA